MTRKSIHHGGLTDVWMGFARYGWQVSYTETRIAVKTSEIVSAWRKILKGERPVLSIEITRECPVHCTGCYAYGEAHLGGGSDSATERLRRAVAECCVGFGC
jgi:radical SAM superfamily enzyme YgiQ (UPF0313 family)